MLLGKGACRIFPLLDEQDGPLAAGVVQGEAPGQGRRGVVIDDLHAPAIGRAFAPGHRQAGGVDGKAAARLAVQRVLGHAVRKYGGAVALPIVPVAPVIAITECNLDLEVDDTDEAIKVAYY